MKAKTYNKLLIALSASALNALLQEEGSSKRHPRVIAADARDYARLTAEEVISLFLTETPDDEYFLTESPDE